MRVCRSGVGAPVGRPEREDGQGAYPYLRLDAKQEKVRDGAHVVSKALVIAYGVHETGRREVIGLDVGQIESEAFWRVFLRSLRRRGLDGVRLCVSDSHEGLKNAIARLLGCRWRRCTVHFVRDMHQHCRPSQRALVSSALREVFNADGPEPARERVSAVIEQLTPVAPKVSELLEAAEEDLLAFCRFPAEHWSKLRSTNPLERVNREIGRRSDVVGIFPNDAAPIRLAGMLLIEQNDEWLVARRHLSQESLAAAVPTGGRRGGRDQSATVKRAQGEVERALGDPEPGGELRGRDRPRMAGADSVEHRLLALAQSPVRTTGHAPAGPPGPAVRDTCRHAAGTLGMDTLHPSAGRCRRGGSARAGAQRASGPRSAGPLADCSIRRSSSSARAGCAPSVHTMPDCSAAGRATGGVNGHRFLPAGGHRFSPTAAIFSPHWWPSVLPVVMPRAVISRSLRP